MECTITRQALKSPALDRYQTVFMENLKAVWDKLKRQPPLREMAKPVSRFSVAYRPFRLMENALEVFRRYINSGKRKRL
jgi:hypothetical protein